MNNIRSKQSQSTPTTFLIPGKLYHKFKKLFASKNKASQIVNQLLHQTRQTSNEYSVHHVDRYTTRYQNAKQELVPVSIRIRPESLIELTMLSRHLGISRCRLFVDLLKLLFEMQSRHGRSRSSIRKETRRPLINWSRLEARQCWDDLKGCWNRKLRFFGAGFS